MTVRFPLVVMMACTSTLGTAPAGAGAAELALTPDAWSSIESVSATESPDGVRLEVTDPTRSYGNASTPITADWTSSLLIVEVASASSGWYVALSGGGIGFATVAEGTGAGTATVDPGAGGSVEGRATLNVHVGASGGSRASVVVRRLLLVPKPALAIDRDDVDLAAASQLVARVEEPDGEPYAGPLAARLSRGAEPLEVVAAGSGRFAVALPRDMLPGVHAVDFTLAGDPERHERRWVRVRAPVLAADQLAFGQCRPAIAVSLSDAYGRPRAATRLEAAVDGRPIRAVPAGPGRWQLSQRWLSPGSHLLSASADGASLCTPVYVSRGNFIRARGTRFVDADGRAFAPMGVEGGGSIRHGKQPRWSPFTAWPAANGGTLDAHCAYLASCGINVLRVGLNLAEGCLDTGEGVSFPLAVRLAGFLDSLGRHGLRAQLVLYWGPIGHFGFDERTAPGYAGTDEWLTGPRSRRRQLRFVDDLTRLFAADDRIFAWEIQNELGVSGDMNGERARTEWVHAIRDALRAGDPNHLVGISYLPWGSGEGVDPLLWARELDCDFFQFHYSVGGEFAAQAAYGQLSGRPFLAGEFGTSRESEECEARITRDCLWASLLSGAAGAIGWHQDWVVPEEFRVPAVLLERYAWPDEEALPPARTVPVTEPWGSAADARREAVRLFDAALSFQPVPSGALAEHRLLRGLVLLTPTGRDPVRVAGAYGGLTYASRHVVVAYLCNRAATRQWPGYGGPLEYRDPGPTPLTIEADVPHSWRVEVLSASTGEAVWRGHGQEPCVLGSASDDLVVVARR